MKLSNSRAPQMLFIVLSFVLLLAVVQTHATLLEQAAKAKARAKPVLVLVVSHGDPEEPQSNMDAVVLVENGKLTQPYPEYNEAAQKKFAGNYFAPGKKYRVTFGGGEVGTATVKSSAMGCNSIHAAATVDDHKKIPPHLSALATDSAALGKKPAARRPPTDAEREGVMKIVRQIYRARGTLPASMNTIKTTNLTATDLNGDGEFELIGSFVLESKTPNSSGTKTPDPTRTKSPKVNGPTSPKVMGTTGPTGNSRRDLFLIAEPQRETPTQAAGAAGPSLSAEASFSAGPPLKATLVNFQSYKLPPEGFDSAEDFVDQLDLDGDGVAEVFVQQHGFDAYGYSIYKKTKTGWRKVYTATGDAC